MVVKIKKILILLKILLINFITVSATDITIIENDYGTKNYLLALYLCFLLVFWFIIYRNTSEININEKKILASVFNSILRILCYIWFMVIFYISRAILFVSSNELFLDNKLFIINIMFYITIFIVSIYVLVNIIKYWGKASGVQEFLKNMIYEVKNANE